MITIILSGPCTPQPSDFSPNNTLNDVIAKKCQNAKDNVTKFKVYLEDELIQINDQTLKEIEENYRNKCPNDKRKYLRYFIYDTRVTSDQEAIRLKEESKNYVVIDLEDRTGEEDPKSDSTEEYLKVFPNTTTLQDLIKEYTSVKLTSQEKLDFEKFTNFLVGGVIQQDKSKTLEQLINRFTKTVKIILFTQEKNGRQN